MDALLVAETVLVWLLLTAVQFPLRKSEHRVLRIIVFAVKIPLIPLAAFLQEGLEWSVPYTHGTILTAVYLALIGDVAASAVEYIVRRIRAWNDLDIGKRRRFNYKIGMPLGLTVCIAVLVLGTVNAETVCMDTHRWQADGLEQEHTFAFAADLHTGSSMSMDALRDFCDSVNGSGAEFLILGGDVTDELTSYEDMVETYRILSTVDVPVYMVFGNHDRQPGAHYVGGRTYSDEQLMDAIDKAGITPLRDEFVRVADDIVLLGREDMSVGERKDWSELVNPYDKGTLIIADHQPYDKSQLDSGISALQLSGHTHAGQLWPLETIYKLIGLPVYGEFDHSPLRLFVTPGVSGWAPLLRTESHSGWELITLYP